MNQGTRSVLLMQKNHHRKSHAWAPLRSVTPLAPDNIFKLSNHWPQFKGIQIPGPSSKAFKSGAPAQKLSNPWPQLKLSNLWPQFKRFKIPGPSSKAFKSLAPAQKLSNLWPQFKSELPRSNTAAFKL
jgi:hypothetical protein